MTEKPEIKRNNISMIINHKSKQDYIKENLIAALKDFIYETTRGSPLEDDGSHKCTISRETLESGRKAFWAAINK